MSSGPFALGRLALILAVVAATNQALAAPAPPAGDPGETPQYRAMLEEAVSEYDARRYEEARAIFRRAHDISPNARTLRGIGMASFELREYVEALRSLEGSLADKRRPLTPTQRQQVESLLERTRAFVGRYFVKTTPKETVIRIDGSAATPEGDGGLLLSFGRHNLVVSAPGSVAETRDINVIGGERQELLFQLRAEPASSKTAGAGLTAPPAGTTADSQSSGSTWWFGGAAVVAAGAIGTLAWWRQLNGELSKCDAANRVGSSERCTNRDQLASRRRVALGTTIGTAAGAVALGIVGAVIWSTNGKPESGTALACIPAPGAVNCELRLSF